jgi:hypothetical protein
LPVYIDALIDRPSKLLKNRHIPKLEGIEDDRQRYAIARSLWLTKRWPHSYLYRVRSVRGQAANHDFSRSIDAVTFSRNWPDDSEFDALLAATVGNLPVFKGMAVGRSASRT